MSLSMEVFCTQKNALLHYTIYILKQYFFITANINTIIVIAVIVFDHAKENDKYIVSL